MYLFVGIIIGIMSGFFGVGGGFILTPLLLLMGFPPVVAIATSLMYTIGTSVSGVVAHYRLKNIEWKTAGLIGVSGIAATQVAHPFVLFLENRQLDDTVIPVFYLFLLGYFAFSMLRKGKAASVTPGDKRSKTAIAKVLLIGFFGGFMSTALGVGGGFIIVPLLISALSMQPKKAVGTSLLSVFFIVISGFISYSFSTPIDYVIGAVLVVGALIGGQIGAALTSYFADKEIRKMLGLLYISTWISILLKLFHFELAGLIILTLFIFYLLVIFSMKYYRHRKTEMKAQKAE